jgi:hypothetical protein
MGGKELVAARLLAPLAELASLTINVKSLFKI